MDQVKAAIGKAAADLIQDGMLVGLGSGSTASYFIQALAARCKLGLQIQAASSSAASTLLARETGIPLVDIDTLSKLDITVDGADEIDPAKRMIKGKGGALIREKILAKMSTEMVVIVDETKLVAALGTSPLPIEIIPFAYKATERHLHAAGFKGNWRLSKENKFYITDNGNYIFDIVFNAPCAHPENDHTKLKLIPGVVDTGFFFDIAGRVIVGFKDNSITVV